MFKSHLRAFIILLLINISAIILSSCSNSQSDTSSGQVTGSRDNTAVVLTGVADGLITYGNNSVIIDASHTSDGYVCVNYTGSNSKVKLQITGNNSTTYTYNLQGGYETFPLTSGDGTYTISIFENIEGTSIPRCLRKIWKSHSLTNLLHTCMPASMLIFQQILPLLQKGKSLQKVRITTLK